MIDRFSLLRLSGDASLDLSSAGASLEEILKDYPFLGREDLFAALEYAARQTDHVVLQAS